MSLNIYLSPLVGTGATIDDAIRPAVHDTIRSVGHAVYCSSPGKNWCLVLADVDAATDTLIRAITGVRALPAATLALNALTAAQQTALTNALSGTGVTWSTSDFGRDLLTRLGLKHDPLFALKYNIPNHDANVGLI